MNFARKRFLPFCAAVLACFIPGCVGHDNGTNAPSGQITLFDVDKDGVPNIIDNDIDNDKILNTADTDIDGDGKINTQDDDIDGDGVININDNDIDGDGIPNNQDADIDGDGKINTQDDDIDGDGVININDNDIDGDGIPNNQDADIDGDGTPNTSDDDIDGDGIANKDDADIDGDGIANTDDPDIDNDGIPNTQDTTPGGTGSEISGTQGQTNTGPDIDSGTINNGTDADSGETADDIYTSGIGVVAVDTVGYSLSISPDQGTGTVSSNQIIDLNKVRDEIENNDIALSTFSLTDLSIVAPASNSFIQANPDTRIVVKVSYFDQNNNKNLVLESAAVPGLAGPVLTVGDLAQGIELNREIFGASQGFSSFTQMIKDESKASVATVIEITFLDDPVQGTPDLGLHFVLKAAGKKASAT